MKFRNRTLALILALSMLMSTVAMAAPLEDTEPTAPIGTEEPVEPIGTEENTESTEAEASALMLELEAADEPIVPLDGEDEVRTVQNINESWKYSQDAYTPADPSNTDAWETVSVPHTWNADDGSDGGNNYRRGVSWYVKEIEFDSPLEGKKVFIDFKGACLITNVYVNGEHAGEHRGGYTAFRFEITEYLEDGVNTIAVSVDNRSNVDVSPRGGDFTVFGGIYRDVSLIVTDEVHIDAENNATSGIFLTPNFDAYDNDKNVALNVRSEILNDSDASKEVTVTVTLREPDGFVVDTPLEDHLRFDPTTLWAELLDGDVVETMTEVKTIAAGESWAFDKDMAVNNPHLWNGREDPYRYVVEVEVKVGGTVVDAVTENFGFRYFDVTRADGATLNGEHIELRGVSRHQDGYNVAGDEYLGNALTKAEHERDMGLIYELGANYVRLAHYPHDPYFYELCDKYGIVVWAEIPMVGGTTNSDAFIDNAVIQLTEMIRQQYNRASVFFWGLSNEVSASEFVIKLIKVLNDTAKDEDPTRLTTLASVGTSLTSAKGLESDLLGWNIYPNWYYVETLDNMMQVRYTDPEETRPVGISEYGAGGSLFQHEDPPVFTIGMSRGHWHPEEYQAIWHEDALRDINDLPWLWSTAVWNMFDFGSDGRNEGGVQGVNNKGLVSQDRQTKKDAFFLYKANWNKEEKFVHITSSRFEPREDDIVTVKVYTNCENVSLVVNETSYEAKPSDEIGVVKFENIPLVVGTNTVTATGGTGITDTITWTRVLGREAELRTTSNKYVIDNVNALITLRDAITVGELLDTISGISGTTFELQDDQGAEVANRELEVTTTMKIAAKSQDAAKNVTFKFLIPSLSGGKVATARDEIATNPASFAVDMNGSTFWSAGVRGGGAWITVDLGESYVLNDIEIEWANNGGSARTYRYAVQASTDGRTFTQIVDRTVATDNPAAPSMGRVKMQNAIDDVMARYIRINNIQGPGFGDCAEIYEIVLNGWSVTSDIYAIDYAAKTITIPGMPEDSEMPWETFEAGLTLKGTYRSTDTVTGAYYVSHGDKWIIVDSTGNETEYTVYYGSSPSIPGEATDLKVVAANGNQPRLEARSDDAQIIRVDGLYFKDLNNDGKLSPYEDWRLSAQARASDLVSRMTLAEKAGQMVIHTKSTPNNDAQLNPTTDTDLETRLITHFVERASTAPSRIATFHNSIQKIAEAQRLGIPAVWGSNARNTNTSELAFGFQEDVGTFTTFPSSLGLTAATIGDLKLDENDYSVIEDFAEIVRKEWNAAGINKGYTYMADLASDPRWSRNFETFGDDPELIGEIMYRLITGVQNGNSLSSGGVAMTTKHFPGGGAPLNGMDPHYQDGKYSVFATENSLANYHLIPWRRVIEANSSSIMPYYSEPHPTLSATQVVDGYTLDFTNNPQDKTVGNAFNDEIVTKLLRDILDFKGYVNSDSNILVDKHWGWDSSEPGGWNTVGGNAAAQAVLVKAAVNAGTDMFSNYMESQTNSNRTHLVIAELVESGDISLERVDEAVTRILIETFHLGYFENPYRDPDEATAVIEDPSHWEAAYEAHQKSVVLLKNESNVLPLTANKLAGKKVYVEAFANNASNTTARTNSARQAIEEAYGITLTDDYTEADYALLFLYPTQNMTQNQSPAAYPDLSFYENRMLPKRDGTGEVSYTSLYGADRLETIYADLNARGGKVITSMNFRTAFVVDRADDTSHALLVGFDTYLAAVLDVISGEYNPTGGLPFGLPASDDVLRITDDVCASPNDVPSSEKHLYMGGGTDANAYAYVDSTGNAYKFGFGLSYPAVTPPAPIYPNDSGSPTVTGSVQPADVKQTEDNVEVNLTTAKPTLSDAAAGLITELNETKPIVINGPTVSLVIPAGTLSAGSNVNDMILNAAQAKDGAVIQVTLPDGTKAILPFSVVKNGSAAYIASIVGAYKLIENSKTFTDQATIPTWADSAVGFVTAHEFFQGDDRGAFNGSDAMTRYMIATVLGRIGGAVLGEDVANSFGDMPNDHWAAPYVLWSAAMGIVQGDGESFLGDQNVTREQLCVMLHRFITSLNLALPEADADGANPEAYSDMDDVNTWAKDSVSLMIQLGIIQGKSNQAIDPQGEATRYEVAVILERFVTVIMSNL